MLKRSIRALVAGCAGLASFAPLATAAPADDRVPLGGGSPIIVVGREKLACTLTAIGHDADGNIVGLTAGHCGDLKDSVISEVAQEAGSLGIVAKKRSDPDIAVIQFNPNRVIPTATTGNLKITGLSRELPPPQSWVCKLGRTTGWACGPLVKTSKNKHISSMCVAKGDSGAPVVIGGTLVGMLNEYVNQYFLDLPCARYEGGTNIGAVLDSIGPGVGEGFELEPA
ncbi:putative peptidase S1 family protein [Segniliparus rotundus DSM 44985]|uniref:Putative peptidase S1 family protein n=1 Tax=Segniliparus rotundus (strain ATCC BAA-972 / CDC 1076 / CIP 108378 / DSM 44985 / JCM 13578) TaxID=640132 RepID=D6Z981_SEGRD|nr:hypothetical protein [Segniliparus rotundus]ADG98511.1 putative peptidase S1 family protein [Segniliparus rotundus DSM 44985]